MGQTLATERAGILKGFKSVKGFLQSQVISLHQVATLKYDEFVEAVDHLNKVTRDVSDTGGKGLVFAIKSHSDDTVLWKKTVRINCYKVDLTNGQILSTRELSLRQFIRVFESLSQQVQAITDEENLEKSTSPESDNKQRPDGCPPELCVSTLFLNIDQISKEADENECCICLDNRSEVILSCTHSYCQKCIDQWKAKHSTCPQCRDETGGVEDVWVMSDKPDDKEVANYVVGVADTAQHLDVG
ncbi:RING finger protein 141-like [Anneissia japonica]|uniref:RING finger protein 141-like n=1 Tax=Anneissia japonica TaxID=1529436 RepID=UPI00142594F4|nr:RING finger protein 141-like [Anneissia japonica]